MSKSLAIVISVLGIVAAASAQAESTPWTLGATKPPTWQGFYVGFNAGGAWGKDEITQSTAAGANTGFGPHIDTATGEVGFHGGYNYLLNGVLIGADADWDYAGADDGYRLISNGSGQDQKYQWLSTVRARLGLPMGNFLPYITGGAAFSDIKDSYVNSAGFSANSSNTRTGWVVGAGLEYAMPENFTFRLDYRYMDFGSYTDTPASVFPGFRYKQEPTLSSVTAGISYNFW